VLVEVVFGGGQLQEQIDLIGDHHLANRHGLLNHVHDLAGGGEPLLGDLAEDRDRGGRASLGRVLDYSIRGGAEEEPLFSPPLL
jgi:hypothetical protein